MSYISSKKIYYINSRNRVTGNDSDFTFKIDQGNNDDFNKVCVLDMIVPVSYYLVETGFNTFTLQELGVNYTVTMTPGNYSLRSFKTVLQSVLNSASGHTWSYIVSSDTVTTSANTGKLYFSVSGNSGQPSFIFTNYLYEQLGFNSSSTNTFTSDLLTSTNTIKLVSEDALYLHSNIADNGDDDVLTSVFGSGNPSFSNIHFTCPDVQAYSKKIASNQSNVYRFFLTNEDSEQIQLNGQNIVIVLMLWKEEEIYNKLNSFLELFTRLNLS